MQHREVVVLLACLGVAAGCGNSRTPVPSLSRPAAVQRYRRLAFAAAGAAFSVPAGWAVTAERPPLIAVVASGDAVIALWRYHRSQPPISSPAALATARAALLRAIHHRQPSIRVLGARLAPVDGAPAIVLDALERVAGSPRRVLSTHVYAGRGELVLDEYAPAGLFSRAAYPVFARVRASLTLPTASR